MNTKLVTTLFSYFQPSKTTRCCDRYRQLPRFIKQVAFTSLLIGLSAELVFGQETPTRLPFLVTSPKYTIGDDPIGQAKESVPLVKPNVASIEPDGRVKTGAAPKSVDADQTKKQDELAKRVASAYKSVYYENDFSYLCDPDYTGWALGDGLKKQRLLGGGWFDLGGEYRARLHREQNHRGLGLTGRDDDFLLHRTRFYGDFHFTPDIRVFAEIIDAESNYESFTPRGIEVNRTDMLNLFADLRLLAKHDFSWSARIGRQELLLGSQRVISPLDWANTRRTFEGIRATRKSKDLVIDGFWTHPVRTNDHSFDSPDRDQEFMGVYASFLGQPKVTTDFYALRYLNGLGTNQFEANTVGWRQQGSNDLLMWDFESAYQFGENNDGSDRSAATVTAGVGKSLTDLAWAPAIWLYYDWASGDNDRGQGNGYDHLFPLGHKYNGFMDLFGRRNLEDVNLMFTVTPSKKLKLLLWYHYFFLENKHDTPYTLAMTAFNPTNSPGSADLGHEIDLLATWSLTSRQEFVFGYSHFFSGDYYQNTPGISFAGDANFAYGQYSIRY